MPGDFRVPSSKRERKGWMGHASQTSSATATGEVIHTRSLTCRRGKQAIDNRPPSGAKVEAPPLAPSRPNTQHIQSPLLYTPACLMLEPSWGPAVSPLTASLLLTASPWRLPELEAGDRPLQRLHVVARLCRNQQHHTHIYRHAERERGHRGEV